MATARGLTFCPPEHQLTDVYLQRELAGHPVPATLDFVHHVDIYTADPEHLVEKRAQAPGTGKEEKSPVWYFVSPVRTPGGGRKARAVIGGTWHEENNKAVKGSTLGGFVKTFTYVKKSSSGKGKERLGWIMKEYDISEQNGGGHRVLCKIYRTPRKKSSASSSATTSSSMSDSGDSKKRKAASDHPDAPTPSAPRTYHQENNFMEGSGESEHYDTAAYFYATTTHVRGGETMESPGSGQESFLPSPAHMQGGNLEFPSMIEDLDDLEDLLNRSSDYQHSEEEIQAMMLELSR